MIQEYASDRHKLDDYHNSINVVDLGNEEILGQFINLIFILILLWWDESQLCAHREVAYP